MLKSFALVDNIWLDKKLKLPLKFTHRYIIHDFFNGEYPHKHTLHQWVKDQQEWGRYPIIIEFISEYDRKDHNKHFQTLKNFVSVIRLVVYNRVFLRHIVSSENGRITMSTTNDEFRPSSFLGENEELTELAFEQVESIASLFKKFIDENKNLRLPRAALFWDSSSCSGNFERKVVELFTSLESLFSTDNSEIAYKLANRMSWFVESSNAERRLELFNEIKKGYDLRSKIVHGDEYSKKLDVDLVKKLHSLARDVLLQIFDNDLFIEKLSQKNGDDLNKFYSSLTSGVK